jgi:pimeloyl-ACP methyl ester carboxylesterase
MKPGEVKTEPFSVTVSGVQFEGQKGRLGVRENRHREDSRTIELAFVRIRSAKAPDAPPLVYLHGGPGGQAINAAREMAKIWAELREVGDVVLLDQRGCGQSKPSLTCPIKDLPPLDIFTTRKALGAWLEQAARAAAAELRTAGVDFAGYDTEQNADDVDDLRKALGVEKIRLLGFSYGTHLGLAVLRRHGAFIDRAILVGVEGFDQTRKLPSAYDTHIAKLSVLVARDPTVGEALPDFAARLRAVLARLAEQPVTARIRRPEEHAEVSVPVGRDGLILLLAWDLGDTSDLVVFPRLIHELERGEAATLSWFVEKRYRQLAALPTLLFTMDPASGCSEDRAARIAREASWAVLGDGMNLELPQVEALFGTPTLGEGFRRPFVCTVPTLFLSGTLDANTPPYQAEEQRWGFADSVHLVQQNGGHEDWLRNPAVPAVLRAFLAGEDVAGHRVDLPPVRFAPLTGAATSHPALRR